MPHMPMKSSKEEIANIISKRDNISYEEAWDIVKETQWAINDALEAGAGYDEIEDLLLDWLGLEMDYIMPFLFND